VINGFNYITKNPAFALAFDGWVGVTNQFADPPPQAINRSQSPALTNFLVSEGMQKLDEM